MIIIMVVVAVARSCCLADPQRGNSNGFVFVII